MTASGIVMLRRAIISLLLLAAALSAGWLAVQREPIAYDVLENRYAALDSRFLTLSDGLVVHYVDEGPKNAPVVLMVHGLASSVDTWSAWAEDLKEDYRVIRVDLPGHGLTRSPELGEIPISYLSAFLDEFATQLGLNDFVLIGSSLGGHAAWHYALQNADALNGLVLIAAAGLPDSPDEISKKPLTFQLIRHPLFMPVLSGMNPESLVKNGLNGAYAQPEIVTQDQIDRYTDLALAPGHRKTLLQLASRPRDTELDDQESLKSLDLPVLILQGDADIITPPEHSERLSQLISGAELIMYPGIGHLPHEEAADQSLSDLRGFLERLSPEPDNEAHPQSVE